MTFLELKKEVCSLGFERNFGEDRDLLFCAERALRQIAAERPCESVFPFIKPKTTPILHIPTIRCRVGDMPTFALPNGGYSLRVRGTGKVSAGRRTTPFSNGYVQLRGRCRSDESLVFSGTEDFFVYDLCLFDAPFLSEAEIPFGAEMSEYDMESLIPRFWGFAAPVTDGRGRILRDVQQTNGKLRVPSAYSGEIRIPYRRAPRPIDPERQSEAIDVRADVLHLLPLLTAAYLWLDDHPERAQYYMGLYRDGMNRIAYRGDGSVRAAVEDVHGWA